MKTAAPRAIQEKAAFRMSCAVECRIDASAERVWSLLTNAADFPRWNSTVSKIDGNIELGEKLLLEVPAAPGRTFKPRVSQLTPNQSMEWSDGFAPMFKGVRTFTLTPNADGSTNFNMTEVFSGLMLPMIKGSLPDFGPSFEAYAADLKREAEGKSVMAKVKGDGTKDSPWTLSTPPGTSEYEAYRDAEADPPALVVQVGKTQLRYHLRAIEDLHAMLVKNGDWVLLGSADEQKPAAEGTVEAWGRAAANPVKGWYGLKKGLRGRFGMYLPPVLEALGLAEVEHNPKSNRMRAIAGAKAKKK